MWFIGVEVERETSAPPPKKNPGSAPEFSFEINESWFGDFRESEINEVRLLRAKIQVVNFPLTLHLKYPKLFQKPPERVC